LREEHRLTVFENRVLRTVFAPPKKKVMGGWRKLHNDEIIIRNFSPNIIKLIKSGTMRHRDM
jgi:hypothetical protein